eukprot:scaffold6107_cov64-Cylindrotheca_fusiformis.AAC.2
MALNGMMARRLGRRVPSSLYKISHVQNRVASTQSRSTPPSIAKRSQDSHQEDTIVSSYSPTTKDASFLPFDEKEESKQDTGATFDEDKMAADSNILVDVDMEELQKLASVRCTLLSPTEMFKYAVDFSDQAQRLRNMPNSYSAGNCPFELLN